MAIVVGALGLGVGIPATFPLPYVNVHYGWWAMLFVIAVLHYVYSTWKPFIVLSAWATITVALGFYMADPLCLSRGDHPGYLPGTHFMWHVLSGAGTFILLLSLPPEDWEDPGRDIDGKWYKLWMERRLAPAGSQPFPPPRPEACGCWCRSSRSATQVVPEDGGEDGGKPHR